MVINGSKMPEREVDIPALDGAKGIMKAVSLEDDKLVIRKGGQAKIHKHFLSFYSNRMGFDGKPKPKDDPELEELQEAPLISVKSKKIAEEARKKLLGE